MPDKVIGINIQSQVIIAHSTSQIILMESGQSTVYIITRVLRAQMNRTVQIRFRFCIVRLLQADNSPCRPCVRIILIQFESRIKVLQVPQPYPSAAKKPLPSSDKHVYSAEILSASSPNPPWLRHNPFSEYETRSDCATR